MKHTGFFGTLRDRLGKTRNQLLGSVREVFSRRSLIGDDIYGDLEQILIESDMGVQLTLEIIEKIKGEAKVQKFSDPEELLDVLKKGLIEVLKAGDHSFDPKTNGGPHVTLVSGVNGSGKTTTIGKLAARLKASGNSVLLGAADTFRAAAVEQLTLWSQRVDVPIIKHSEGADPAAVVFDATDAAIARNSDCLIIDTAGRLHTKVNLMEELKKIRRVIRKRLPGAPHEVLLVLDATTGQNGLQQAVRFTEALEVTGIVLTKLDGTAKGGIAVAIQKELSIPIKFIGVGEGIDDLQPFNAREFVEALLGG